MTFEDALLNSGYIYDKFVGSFMKEESNGDLHTYLNVEDNEWIYERYDINDQELESVAITIN
jgi:hypothetical protein